MNNQVNYILYFTNHLQIKIDSNNSKVILFIIIVLFFGLLVAGVGISAHYPFCKLYSS